MLAIDGVFGGRMKMELRKLEHGFTQLDGLRYVIRYLHRMTVVDQVHDVSSLFHCHGRPAKTAFET